ncbi:MAG: hypothetical protein ACPGVO_12430, partial [Spirulinaceae cyanobacterium]
MQSRKPLDNCPNYLFPCHMNTTSPDIIVVSPDGEYWIVVEVKLNDSSHQRAIEQLKHYMASVGCALGLVITGERISLLRDSFEKFHGESITVAKKAILPESLLPPVNESWLGNKEFEFALRVQLWLETLGRTSSLESLPEDLQELFGEPIISLIRFGEIRAAGPRWSGVAS